MLKLKINIMTRKEKTLALYEKYFDLVWYARSSKKNEHIKGVKEAKMRIENEHTEDVINLIDDYDNWQHGFNSGMYAALGLMIDKSSKMDESNISLDT